MSASVAQTCGAFGPFQSYGSLRRASATSAVAKWLVSSGWPLMPVKSRCQVVDQVPHGEVHAELALEQLGREQLAVVVDAAAVLLEPLAAPAAPRRGSASLRAPDELELVDLLDVDAERASQLSVPAVAVYIPIGRPPIRPKVIPRSRLTAPAAAICTSRRSRTSASRMSPHTRAYRRARPGRARRLPRASRRDPAARDRGSSTRISGDVISDAASMVKWGTPTRRS